MWHVRPSLLNSAEWNAAGLFKPRQGPRTGVVLEIENSQKSFAHVAVEAATDVAFEGPLPLACARSGTAPRPSAIPALSVTADGVYLNTWQGGSLLFVEDVVVSPATSAEELTAICAMNIGPDWHVLNNFETADLLPPAALVYDLWSENQDQSTNDTLPDLAQ